MQEQDPLEPIIEASIVANKKGHENTGDLLEALIQQNEKNNPEPLLEASIEQSKKNTTKIVEALKPVENMANTTKKMVEFLEHMKGEKGDKGEPGKDAPVVDEKAMEERITKGIRIPKDGIDGKTPVKGKDYFTPAEIYEFLELATPKKGKDYFDGLDATVDEESIVGKLLAKIPKPKDGKDGKDGKDFPKDVLKKLEERIKKIDEANLLWVNNSAVRSISAGSGISIDNTDPQNPIITATGGVGGGTWGSITGTLSDQTDLQTALDAKANLAGATFTGNVSLGANQLTVHNIRPDASDGLLLESNNGTDIGVLGAGNTANVTWYGSHNFDTVTASRVAQFGASKTLESSSVTTTELGYLSGVTSAIQTQLGNKEDVSNKATSFGTVNDTLYPSVQAVKTYADGLVAGLLDYRGGYDASGNVFPSSGGSGTAGAVMKGDMWVISVAGTLGGNAIKVGDSIIANVDTPGQTSSNWNTLNTNITYVPEDQANKVTSISGSSTDTQYPSAKLLYDQLALKDAVLTFSTGLTRTTNTITVNTTQNIAKLSNLTSNGFVKTSGGDGTLSVDTNTYLTANQTITLSGDITGSGTTGITTTLPATTISGKTLKSTLAGTEEVLINDAGTLKKTTTQDIADLGGGGSSVLQDGETPSGTINGSNTAFTLSYTPSNPNGVIVVLNGVVQYNGTDYTISGTTITFTTAPVSGSTIFAYNGVTGGTSPLISDTAYGGSWNGVTTIAPSKNAVYDEMELRAPKADPTFTGTVNLASGSTTKAPLKIATGGSLLTTPEDGAVEMDDNCFYGTVDAGNRGIIPVEHIIRADATRTFTSNTSQQAIFDNPTNGTLTLETGTYLFEGLIAMTSMSATSGNGKFSLIGAGTATLGDILWNAWGNDNASQTTGAAVGGMWSVIATQTATNIVTAGTGTAMSFMVKGTFTVTVAGTIIPSFAQTTAAAAIVSVGSYFKCNRIGSTSMTSVGQWS